VAAASPELNQAKFCSPPQNQTTKKHSFRMQHRFGFASALPLIPTVFLSTTFSVDVNVWILWLVLSKIYLQWIFKKSGSVAA
jgi:hypothetical protein